MGARHHPIAQELVILSGDAGMLVRGVSPYHLSLLYFRHKAHIAATFDAVAEQVKGLKEITPEIVQGNIEKLFAVAPHLVAELMALAQGLMPEEPEWRAEVDACLLLPMGKQIETVQKIFGLTFTSEMPPGKFLALVVNLVENAVASRQRQS